MTHLEAIAEADQIRDTAMPEDLKGKYLFEVESRVAELMEVSLPDPPLLNHWPADQPLLMPEPYSKIYPLYLASKYDYFNEEGDQYANDAVQFEAAWAEARAYWRRHHRPTSAGNWRVI